MKNVRGKAYAENGSLQQVYFPVYRARCLTVWAHVLYNCPSIPRPQVLTIHKDHWRNEEVVTEFL